MQMHSLFCLMGQWNHCILAFTIWPVLGSNNRPIFETGTKSRTPNWFTTSRFSARTLSSSITFTLAVSGMR